MPWADWIAPLPIRARPIHGEGLGSFARRAAALNGLTVSDVREWAGEQNNGVPLTRDEWRMVWSRLGPLHPEFGPAAPDSQWLPERVLCLRCSKGVHATGTYLAVGHICLKHHAWIGRSDWGRPNSLHLKAERRFRRLAVATPSVDVQSTLVRWAYEIAVRLVVAADESLPALASHYWPMVVVLEQMAAITPQLDGTAWTRAARVRRALSAATRIILASGEFRTHPEPWRAFAVADERRNRGDDVLGKFLR